MILVDINKTKTVIYQNENIRELRHKLEELSYEYLRGLQVTDLKYYKKSKSGRWGNVPEGFFMVYEGNKIQIYNKILQKGIIYNGCQVFKFITFELVEPSRITPMKNTNVFCLEDLKKKMTAFHDVHQDLIKDKKEN